QRNFLARVVARANRFRSLKRHVLEHVREAGLPHGILHRARIHVREKRKHRRFRTLTDDDGKPIGKLLHRSALLESSQILAQSDRAQQETDNSCLYESQAGFHPASKSELQPNAKNRSYVEAVKLVKRAAGVAKGTRRRDAACRVSRVHYREIIAARYDPLLLSARGGRARPAEEQEKGRCAGRE